MRNCRLSHNLIDCRQRRGNLKHKYENGLTIKPEYLLFAVEGIHLTSMIDRQHRNYEDNFICTFGLRYLNITICTGVYGG